MRRAIEPGRILFCLAFLFIGIFALTGCVSPIVDKKPDVDLSVYHKVYFAQRGSDPRQVYPRVLDRLQKAGFVVTALYQDDPPVGMQGSGFIISSEGDVLTCAHVVRNCTKATIWVEGARYPCRVLVSDTNFDLALLAVEGKHPPFQALRLKTGEYYSLGQNVFTIGFPLVDVLGVSPRMDNGMISAKVGMDDDTNSVQISVPVQAGNSGGPLLNGNGEVVGVVSSTLNPLRVLERTGGDLPQNVNFAIKLSEIRKFLAKSNASLPQKGSFAENIDEVEKSAVLVRPGDVTEAELKEPELFCSCAYLSIFDFYWRFRIIQIRFIDAKTGNVVLRVGQSFDTHQTENGELDDIFSAISGNFFSDRPNPFK
jgi:S1-C subfamily serine protease